MIALSPVAAAVVASPAAAITAEEQAFVDAINASRAAAGLPPLTVDEELSLLADRHSAQMAGAGTIFHTADLAGKVGPIHPTWTRLGENVGMGGSVESIHAAMLASPQHASNIYGDYNLIGIGVETNPGGIMFVTEIFAKAAVTGGIVATEPVTSTDAVAPAPAPAPELSVVESASASASAPGNRGGGGGGKAVKTRTVRSSGGGRSSAGTPNRSEMGEARNAAGSGGRRGAPDWAQNDK